MFFETTIQLVYRIVGVLRSLMCGTSAHVAVNSLERKFDGIQNFIGSCLEYVVDVVMLMGTGILCQPENPVLFC